MNRAAIDEVVADLIVAQTRLEAVQKSDALTPQEADAIGATVRAIEELGRQLINRKRKVA